MYFVIHNNGTIFMIGETNKIPNNATEITEQEYANLITEIKAHASTSREYFEAKRFDFTGMTEEEYYAKVEEVCADIPWCESDREYFKPIKDEVIEMLKNLYQVEEELKGE